MKTCTCKICLSQYNQQQSIKSYGSTPSDNNCCSSKCYTTLITTNFLSKEFNIDNSISNLSNTELITLSEECNKCENNKWDENDTLKLFILKHFNSLNHNNIIQTISQKFLIETTKRLKLLIGN